MPLRNPCRAALPGVPGTRIGGALAAVYSRTYNDGVAFIAMIPLVTWDLGRVKLNATYLPKIPGHNEVAAFGFYVSIPLGRRAR